MGFAQAKHYWTVEEYLAFEKTSVIRYEYVLGQIYAMAGGSKNHSRIADDLGAKLNRQFAQQEKECEAFTSDVKVHINSEVYYYPDVVVACEELSEDDQENEYIAENPVLIAEVLSKRTQRTDRIEKMREYQFLPSLREYLIIEQTRYQVEVYRHTKAGEEWQKEIYNDPEQQVFLASINASFTLHEIYSRVRFGALAEDEEREN